jgi:membrane protein YqaA with SNARE-associated domain
MEGLFDSMSGFLENLLSLGYPGVLIVSFTLNLIPFLGPSNLVISGIIGSLIHSSNPLIIGFLIALGASIAKTIHFGLSFFAVTIVKRKQKPEESNNGKREHSSQKLGMIALFIAAASPVPDEPIVIPLGLMRYSPIKFFTAFFTGKILITVVGAYFGQKLGLAFEEYL